MQNRYILFRFNFFMRFAAQNYCKHVWLYAATWKKWKVSSRWKSHPKSSPLGLSNQWSGHWTTAFRRLPTHTILYVNYSLVPRFPSTGMWTLKLCRRGELVFYLMWAASRVRGVRQTLIVCGHAWRLRTGEREWGNVGTAQVVTHSLIPRLLLVQERAWEWG